MSDTLEKEETASRFERFMAGFTQKAKTNILSAWRDVSDSARLKLTGETSPDLVRAEEIAHIRREIDDCLYGKGGEFSARTRTVELGKDYLNLSKIGKQRFLELLAAEYGASKKEIVKATGKLADASDADFIKQIDNLKEMLISPRQKLLRQFNGLPDGFKFLVDMRADLMPLAGENTAMKDLENDLKTLLSHWFDVGLLDLVRITWDSPAAMLEKLIAYEAVHEIRSWKDLKNRLDSDRRCYGFFHAKMPLEPLIFVEVALVKGIAGSVQTLLDEHAPVIDPKDADTAIFYSISNAQKGLAGISFGNFLIKRVAEQISREMPNIKTFATLSPVPGFISWLEKKLESGLDGVISKGEFDRLKKFSGKGKLSTFMRDSFAAKESSIADNLKESICKLCAHYLVVERKNNRAIDPVANFHLSNGARLERINWMADTSEKGFKQAAGIMVNYLYKLSEIEENHEQYVLSGKAAVGRSVKGLLD